MKVTSFKSKYLKEFTERQKLKKLEKKILFLIFVLCSIRYYQMIINREININEVLPLLVNYNNLRDID